MDYLKKRKNIDRILVKLFNCENSEEFYKLSTQLYYTINEIVFMLESDKLLVEKGENNNVSNNRTNCNKWD